MTHLLPALLVALLVLLPWPAAAQGPSLAAAQHLYEAAAYEEALLALSGVDKEERSDIAREVHLLQALSLVALGREAEARDAMRDVVEADPAFVLDAAAAAPRVRTVFAEVRQQHLLPVLRARYAEARAVYARGEYAVAAEGFERVRALIDATGDTVPPEEAATLAELRELADGFRELSLEHVRVEAPGLAEERPAAGAPVAGEPAPPDHRAAANGTHAGEGAHTPAAVGGVGRGEVGQPTGTTGAGDRDAQGVAIPDAGAAATPGFIPPVAISQDMPPAAGMPGLVAGRIYRGTIEIDIDESGAVAGARLVRSIHALYDARLLDAARRWRYRPATRDGAPVSYTRLVVVTLEVK
jgi:TonB family protein